jgi:hypothetical protein
MTSPWFGNQKGWHFYDFCLKLKALILRLTCCLCSSMVLLSKVNSLCQMDREGPAARWRLKDQGERRKDQGSCLISSIGLIGSIGFWNKNYRARRKD